MSTIAIIGGHGKVAMHLARMLSDGGHQVSSLFRNPDHRSDVESTGATPVVADVEHLSTDEIAELIAGHDAVVWSAGAGASGGTAATYAVDRDAAIRSMDAAQNAGVRRYVMVSFIGSRNDHGIPESEALFDYAEAKAAADDYLRGTYLEWTILGPGMLTEDVGNGLIEAAPEPADNKISREDVARVAAFVLDKPETAGRFIAFNNGDTPIEDAISVA
ncbi:SDR family oxidoreductase [Arthrobacter castelli]|uniref:SDR family oxidoreductase n=1 Tax=Arthrobacter castelli TaxID=271431 RepID=UPI000419169E|nr:SDR family oxidoreductase [Arthrobacter castelli]